ncbi:MAG: hypothetical protein AAF658_00495 [Myxococcota bacterium]
MRRLLALACLTSACAPAPMALRYDALASQPVSPMTVDATVVVLLPYDHRYEAEQDGETKTATFTFAFVGFGYGTHRGNYVTGDDRFSTYPGPFGEKTIEQSVGNLLTAGFQQAKFARTVRTDSQPVRWSCNEGTCVADANDVRRVAEQAGAQFVIAPRIAHLFGSQFGEQTAWSASYQETRGQYVYQVNESYREETSAGAAGSAVVELTIYQIADGRILDTQRRSFVGTSSGSAGNDKDGKEATARVAANALQNLLARAVPEVGRTVATMAGVEIPAPGPAEEPEPGTETPDERAPLPGN